MEAINNKGICTIEVEGETIPLRFGMPANRILFEKLADNPTMLSSTNVNEKGVAWLIYAGYVNACMAKDQEPVKDFEYFFAFVEDCSVDLPGELQRIADVYANSRYTQKAAQNVIDAVEDIKKKNPGMISSPSATANSASL